MKFFYILWKKSRLKSTFLPYHVKKLYSTLEMDTFKIMLLLSYLASLDKGVFTIYVDKMMGVGGLPYVNEMSTEGGRGST